MASDQQMTVTQAKVWTFLRERYAGVDNAAPRAAILARFNLLNSQEMPDREFRQIVADLVNYFGKCICTSPAGGYFVARLPREKDEAVRHLRSIGAATFQRAEALEKTDPLEAQDELPL